MDNRSRYMSAPTYLAKDGKVFGPYDSAKVEELRASGKFFEYEWMWDGEAPDWSPVPRKLKSPPPLPGGAIPTVAPTIAVASTPPKPKQNVVIETSDKSFCAIAYNNRLTMGGEVSQAHSRGGRFVSAVGADTPFPKGTTIWLDLLDESNDKSAKVKSVVSGVSRLDTRWVIELEWGGCPLL